MIAIVQLDAFPSLGHRQIFLAATDLAHLADNKQRREQEEITVKQSDLSTSTNNDDPADDTTGIVQIEPGQFEICIDTRREYE